MAVVTRYHHQPRVSRLTVRDGEVRTHEREKKSGVNRWLSSRPVLGHEYLSLPLSFLLQHHLSGPFLFAYDLLKVDFVARRQKQFVEKKKKEKKTKEEN